MNSSKVNDIGQKLAKKMRISMLFHISGRGPPNNIVLIFMYFNNYLAVTYIDVKYLSLYSFLREKVY